MQFEGSLPIFEEEGVDVEYGGEIEGIIDLLGSKGSLIVEDTIDLEEEGLRGILDPRVLIDSNDFSLLIAIVLYMRDCDFLTGLVEILMLHVHEKQTEELFFCLIDLNEVRGTFSF